MTDEGLFPWPDIKLVEEDARAIPILDYAASPTLTTLRETIGEALTIKLVMAKGGTDVYLPERPKQSGSLSRIIGIEAVMRLCEAFGAHRHLEVPTGRGLAHGRRIDPAKVWTMHLGGMSGDQIAQHMQCTARQVRNILSRSKFNQSHTQLSLW